MFYFTANICQVNSGFCVHWSNFVQHQSSPLDLLATTKLFASHCILAYANKSHFYWWDCSAEKLSAYVNKTVQHFQQYGTGRKFTHYQAPDGSNAFQISYSAKFSRWTGYFYWQRKCYTQLEVTSVWNGPFLITVYPSGPGYPVGGGPAIQFPYKGHHVHV